MSSGLLNVASRALLANQVALQTTGHNIANVNTTGYSRQTAVMETIAGQYTGSGYIGKGVDVSTVERAYSQFLTQQAALTQAIQSGDTARATKLSQLQDIFPTGTSGLGAAINDMLNAFADVSSAPTDLTARNVVLTRANELASRFQSASTQLSDLQAGVTQEIGNSVTTVNSLATRIAALNEQIAKATGSGQTPNDLLDQRDQAIHDLNQYVQTSSVAADDGTVSVFIGSQALVLGTSAAQVTLTSDEFGNANRKLAVTRGTVTNLLDENTMGGGSIAGLLRFQNTDLQEGINLLGRMAVALTDQVNAQHQLGLTLDGSSSGNFFTPLTMPNGLPAATNTGSATVGVSVADSTALQPSDYEVQMTGATTGNVVRKSDGQVFAFTSVPATVDGLTFDVSAGAAAGDRFLVQPYVNSASNMGTVFSSPADLAVASPIEPVVSTSNTGTVSVSALVAHPDGYITPPAGGVTLTFTAGSPASYTLAGSTNPPPGTYTYTPGQAVTIDGWDVTLQGTPATGDTITVQDASPAGGGTGYYQLNSGNATALMALRDKAVFDGSALTDGYSGMIAQIGTRTQSALFAASVSQTISANAESDRNSLAGVNLDEEAAKLIQYQQAYQASSKLIQVAQSIFDSLLSSVSH